MSVRLCLFTDSLEPSGVGEHMLTLAATLNGRYDVSFVCPPSSAGLPLLERARGLGLETLALKVRDPGPAAEQLGEWLRARGVTIFHGHAGIGWEGHAGSYAARAAGVPVVLRTEHLPYLLTAGGQRADHRRLLRVIDRLVCVSEEARRSFLRSGLAPRKLCVIRNGISPRAARPDRPAIRARLGLAPDARIVLTVARLSKQKGHRFLVEAIPTIVEREPRAHFVWVGRGPLERKLRARVEQLGLAERAHFVGERADVPELLAGADLFVLPSLFEGLPLVVLEAMAAGLAVVGTRVCGTAEAVRDGATGRLVPPSDPAALATAVLEVLAQPDLAARWGAAGRARLEREFSAARMARETATLYQELLDAQPVGASPGVALPVGPDNLNLNLNARLDAGPAEGDPGGRPYGRDIPAESSRFARVSPGGC